MLYIVKWNDDDSSHSVVAGGHQTAWLVYWMIKKLIASCRYRHPCFLSILTSDGCYVDPLKGEQLPYCETEGSKRVQLNPHWKEEEK